MGGCSGLTRSAKTCGGQYLAGVWMVASMRGDVCEDNGSPSLDDKDAALLPWVALGSPLAEAVLCGSHACLQR